MRNKLGMVFIALGAMFLLASLGLYVWNRTEDDQAGQASGQVLQAFNEAIASQTMTEPMQTIPVESGTEATVPMKTEMTEVEIDGYHYIGRLAIPLLDLALPVMSEWDYGRLKVAPCRYQGTVLGDDLVLLAHNYSRHFGSLYKLEPGAEVIFTDMDGVEYRYQVAETTEVEPTALDKVISADFDLTLITCTYGGKSRVTVYCDRMP